MMHHVSDIVPTKQTKKPLDAGKIVVSGQLLKMLTGQRTAVQRCVTKEHSTDR